MVVPFSFAKSIRYIRNNNLKNIYIHICFDVMRNISLCSQESEDNQDLRDRLKMTEHRFGEIQKKRQSRVTLSAAV